MNIENKFKLIVLNLLAQCLYILWDLRKELTGKHLDETCFRKAISEANDFTKNLYF